MSRGSRSPATSLTGKGSVEGARMHNLSIILNQTIGHFEYPLNITAEAVQGKIEKTIPDPELAWNG